MAFEALVQRYAGRVLGVLERRLDDPDRALDLCQEVWIRVHRSFERDPQAGSRGEFRSWLFAIALNLARDEGRAVRRRRRLLDSRPVEEGLASTAADHEAIERRDAVDAALRRIEEPFRSALVLIDIEGLDYAAAARSAGCAEGTMKSRVARGRARFRTAWQQVTEGARSTGTAT
jgi:RNA polymerase sigma-70 factor (ECF subfamily)